MEIIRYIKGHREIQNITIENNKNEVRQVNSGMAYILLIMSCLILLFFLFLSLILDMYSVLAIPSVLALVAVSILFFFFNKIKEKVPPVGIIYITYAILLVYDIYISSSYFQILGLLLLSQMPVIILDKSWRVNLLVLVYTLFYMLFSCFSSDIHIMTSEMLCSVLFVVFGIGLGEQLRRLRIENLDLKRQALMREKIDDLTGLQNRKGVRAYMSQLPNQLYGDSHIGFIMLDIDYFKRYNDTYGHQAGDMCLQRLGECLKQFGTQHQIEFFRLGGEEFCGVTIHYTEEQLLQICEQLNDEIYRLKIPHVHNMTSYVTVSIGFSVSPDASNLDLLQAEADTALYAAKDQGRNCTVQYRKELGMKIDF